MQNHFFGPIADTVHTSNPFHLIHCFQRLGHTFPLCHSEEFVVLILSVLPVCDICLYPQQAVLRLPHGLIGGRGEDVTIASTVLNHILYRCTVIKIRGESYRLKERKE